jgi:hypothetical protein
MNYRTLCKGTHRKTCSNSVLKIIAQATENVDTIIPLAGDLVNLTGCLLSPGP